MVKAAKSTKNTATSSSKTKKANTKIEKVSDDKIDRTYVLKCSIESQVVRTHARQFDDCNRDEYEEMMEDIEQDAIKHDKTSVIYAVHGTKGSALKAAETKMLELITKVTANSEPEYAGSDSDDDDDDDTYPRITKTCSRDGMLLTSACCYLTDYFGCDLTNKILSTIKVKVVEPEKL